MKVLEKIELLRNDPKHFFFRALNSRFPREVEDYILDLLRPEKSEIINDIDLRFLGMRRSGNHAIIDWFSRSVLEARTGAKHISLNNLDVGRNGYRTRYLLPEVNRPVELTSEIGPARWRKLKKVDILVRSYEDYSFESFYPPEPQKYYGASRIQRNYVILRDPLNLFASRRKSKMSATREKMSEIDLYLNHANLLDQPRRDVRVIIYNSWLTDPEYRAELTQDLGVPPAAISRQPAGPGGGSSFSGTQHEVQEKELLSRWKQMAEQGALNDVMNNEDIQRVIKTHFPDIAQAIS